MSLLNQTFTTRFSLLTTTAVLALAISIPCQANVPTPLTPPAPPAGYCQTIDSELHNDLNAFNTTLNSLWNGTTFPTLYAGNLLSANGNGGSSLISSSHFQQVQTQMQELQAMGYQGIMMAVAFPVLYDPFYGDQAAYQQYVSFYSQVAAMPGNGHEDHRGKRCAAFQRRTGRLDRYAAPSTSSLSWQQYMAARAQMAATIAQVMHRIIWCWRKSPTRKPIKRDKRISTSPPTLPPW